MNVTMISVTADAISMDFIDISMDLIDIPEPPTSQLVLQRMA